jgi:enterochelin esterase-like enzyme
MYVPPPPPRVITRPALVLFDGQNVFDDEGSYAGGWYAHRAIDKLVLAKNAVAPVVIAVDHGGEQRIDELGPWREGNKGGRASAMIDMIADRVLPAARAATELSEFTVIGGSSMGGLAALYAHLSRPEVFAGALAMSPSVWFARRRIFDLVGTVEIERSAIYLDAGALEMRGVLVGMCRTLFDRLRERGWTGEPPKSVMFRTDARGTHSEICWRRRLPKALRFFFGI